MIQDIAPHRYDNTYHIQKPGAQDYVFCIQRGRILLRETAEEHVLTIPRREEIEAAVPELMDRAVYLFSVDEKPYFLVSVPEKEAEEILAKLKEGAGQMPVSDKNNMEAGKTDSGALEGAEKSWNSFTMHGKRRPTSVRWSRDAPGICSDHGGAAVALETEPIPFCGRCGAKTEDSKIERRSSARSVTRRNIQRSPAVIGDHERGQTLCRYPRQPQYLLWICADRWICRGGETFKRPSARSDGGSRAES